METFRLKFGICIVSLLALFACKKNAPPFPHITADQLNAYWPPDKAEVNSYAISESIDGDRYEGTGLIIFRIRDFSLQGLNTVEHPMPNAKDVIRVMHMNHQLHFLSGMNEHNLMTSLYTPMDLDEHQRSLKLECSTQDWTGSTFFQARYKNSRYDIRHFNYPSNTPERDFSLARGYLEDEIWNLIRVAPDRLPIGKVNLIPSPLYLKSATREIKVYPAITTLQQEDGFSVYRIHYPDLNRTLEIEFNSVFPYQVVGWVESNDLMGVSTGRILNTERTDYWNHTLPSDAMQREKLDLPTQ